VSEPDKGPRKIKVVDRRRFDESGDLRPDRPKMPTTEPAPEPAEPAAPAAGPKPSQPVPSPEPMPEPPPFEPVGEDQAPEETSPLFMELIAGLAQQAEMLLTGAQGLPAQPAEAQRMIEYLAMLEAKTSGNLSAEENKLLSGVIFQLRTLFVQHNP
jgi:hypothetical protein